MSKYGTAGYYLLGEVMATLGFTIVTAFPAIAALGVFFLAFASLLIGYANGGR